MQKTDCFYTGIVVSKFSFKGEVLIKLDTDYPEDYLQKESFFMEIHKNMIPFFVEKSSLQKSDLLRVKFEDIDTETAVEELIGKEVYLPLTDLPKLAEDQFYFHEIIGFTVFDEAYGKIGPVKAVNDNTPQALFIIDHPQNEVLIPINDDFILQIDKKKKEIHLRLPDGLLDLYLQ